MAWVAVALDDFETVVSWLALLLFSYGLIAPLLLALKYVPVPKTTLGVTAGLLSYGVLLLVGWASIVRPAVFLLQWKLIKQELCVFGLAVVISVVGIATVPRYAPILQDWWRYAVVAFFLAVVLIVGGFTALAVVVLIVRVSAESLNRLRAPASVATSALIDTLAAIAHAKGVPFALTDRNFILGRLEVAARAVETLVRNVHVADGATLEWTRAMTAGVAATLRYEKRPFALGRASEDPHLITRFAEYVQRAVTGDWAAIRARDPEHRSKRQKLARVGKFAEGLILAVLPATTLYLLWDRLALRAPFSEYVKVGAIVWGALAVALSWDPGFAEKLWELKAMLGGRDKE